MLQLLVKLVDIGLGSSNRISFCVYRYSRALSCLAPAYECKHIKHDWWASIVAQALGESPPEVRTQVRNHTYEKTSFPSPSITVSSPSNQYVKYVKKHFHEKATLGDLYPRHMRVDFIFKCF